MARFLSPAWIEQVATTAAARDAAPPVAPEITMTVRQTVRGGPDGDVSYSFRLAQGWVTVTPDDPAEADVEVTSDYDTAVAISKGELSPAVALAAGLLRVGGKVGLLVEHHDAFLALGDLLGPVRATTEY